MSLIMSGGVGDQLEDHVAAQLRDEDRALVGELVVACTGLEHLAIVGLTISMDADLEKVDLAFKRIGQAAVLDVLTRLAPTLLPEGDLLNRWKRWIESAREIGRRRNDVVHTMWSSVGPDELEGLKRAPYRSVRMPRTEMEQIANQKTGRSRRPAELDRRGGRAVEEGETPGRLYRRVPA